MSFWIFLTNKLFQRFKNWLESHLENGINGIKIRNYTLFNSNQELNIILKLNTVFNWVFNILIVYFSFSLIFGILPWTKVIADTLFGYVINPAKSIFFSVWNYLPNLFKILLLTFIIYYIRKGIHYLYLEVEKGNKLILYTNITKGYDVPWKKVHELLLNAAV